MNGRGIEPRHHGNLDLCSLRDADAVDAAVGIAEVDLVAEAVGLSPKRLSRLFIEEVGVGFSDFLIDLRIEKAKGLLVLPGVTIKQVSAECGYPDPNYFARLFKKVTGLTPSEFSQRS